MSSETKKNLLILFITIDVLIGILIIKSINIRTNVESKNINLKSSGNMYTVMEPIMKQLEPIEEVRVFDNLTYSELSNKLNNILKSSLSGKGELIASYSLELGVDPYLVTGIILQETGCEWGCSYLVQACNNVGGQKGYGCGEYSSFNTLDEGIKAMISNIYNNYYVYGLTTAELINPKYAEDPNWSNNVNKYIERIRNS